MFLNRVTISSAELEELRDDCISPVCRRWLERLERGKWLATLREIDATLADNCAVSPSVAFCTAAALHLGSFPTELSLFLQSAPIADITRREGATASGWAKLLLHLFQHAVPTSAGIHTAPSTVNAVLLNQVIRDLPSDAQVMRSALPTLRGMPTVVSQFREMCQRDRLAEIPSELDTNAPTPSRGRTDPRIQKGTLSSVRKILQLSGLKAVKDRAVSLVAEYLPGLPQNFRLPVGHFVFKGNPGTGKTTVANLFAEMLFELGAIPEEPLPELPKPPPPRLQRSDGAVAANKGREQQGRHAKHRGK